MTTIRYVQNGNLLVVSNNVNIVPRIGDKVEISKFIYRVKDVIWHLDANTWIEVLL